VIDILGYTVFKYLSEQEKQRTGYFVVGFLNL